MRKWQHIGVGGTIVIGLAGIMTLTNPGKKGYQQYADEALETHFKEEVCAEISSQMGQWLRSQCYNLVDTAHPHLAQIIDRHTTRANFILFSIYQTELPIPAMPDYQLETIGMLGTFYTYQADEL